MLAFLLLGFSLGLDSFRVSLGLGSLPLQPARQISIALTFGVCDGLALLAGDVFGSSVAGLVSTYTGWLGPLVLGGYGLYMVVISRHGPSDHERDQKPWMFFGLPIILSLDNLIAGVGMGLLSFSVVLSAATIGLMSVLMSAAGLWLGKHIVLRLPLKAELIGGLTLILLAVVFAFNLFE